ncbi:MAG: hypothetical protein M1335_05615 [Chloroflexi bacterium]|nr:hypothetical protein [Chloroflexota bacterium]
MSGVRDAHTPQDSSCPDLDDTIWIEALKKRGHEFDVLDNPLDLVQAHRASISGAVLYEDRGNFSINNALMISAQKDAIPCTPFLAEKLNLPVVFDTRGMWRDAAEAYSWAVENLWQACHQSAAAFSPNYYFNMMDYLAQHKIFTCHLPNFSSEAEEEVISRVLDLLPPGSPVIGVWDLYYPRYSLDPENDYERMFIDKISEHGHFFLVTHDCGNLSVHSGLKSRLQATVDGPEDRLRVTGDRIQSAPAARPGKTYLSFLFSEGDNLTFQMRNRPVIWEDPARGKAPLGWSTAPLMLELCPLAFDYYESKRTPNDCWVVACSGIGYFFPSMIFKDLSAERAQEAFQRIYRATNEAMESIGADVLWILDHRVRRSGSRTDTEYVADARLIENVLKIAPAAKSVVCDYPDMFDTRNFSPKEYLVNSVPVFHARNRYSPGLTLPEMIRKAAAQPGPPFMLVFVSGWGESPSSVLKYMEELGDGFEAVRPDVMAEMYLGWLGSNANSEVSAK